MSPDGTTRRGGVDLTAIVRGQAIALGIPVPEEDVGPLAEMLARQLDEFAAVEALDLSDVDPSLDFDPVWNDAH
jgi:hypothetical protein